MSFISLFLIPLAFGLFGFIEPCSLGINLIFLRKIQGFVRAKRIFEVTVFMFVRGFFLALMGLTAAFIGSRFVALQADLFVILGLFYIVLGIVSIITMYRPVFTTDINLGKFLQRRGAFALGVVFGLVIPACAITFVLALVGRAVVVGNLLEGFLSLFVFGMALSLPLLIISSSEQSITAIEKLYKSIKCVKWLGGGILIVVGILTMLSSVWWAGAW